MWSAKPSQAADVMGIHADYGTGREQPWSRVRDQCFDKAVIERGFSDVRHIYETFADARVRISEDAAKPRHDVFGYMRPRLHNGKYE